MTLLDDITAALHPVTAQDPHPYLDTATGMQAVTAVATSLGGSAPVHVRTAEYVTARTDVAGTRMLLRAGHRDVAPWHQEELAIADSWAQAGCPVPAPAQPQLHLLGGAAVSVWPYLEHRSGEDADPALAGAVLADLHERGKALARRAPLNRRPFRAPGKTGRRLQGLADTAPPEHGVTVVAAAAAIAALTGLLSGEPVTAIHGDYQPGNWLTTDTAVAVIDFATACVGPTLWDLTLLEGRCGEGRRYPRSVWERFVAGYGTSATVLDGTAAQALRSVATAVAAVRRTPSPETWRRLAEAAAAGN